MDSSSVFLFVNASGTFLCLRGVDISRLVAHRCLMPHRVRRRRPLCVFPSMSSDQTNKGSAVMPHVIVCVSSLNALFVFPRFKVCVAVGSSGDLRGDLAGPPRPSWDTVGSIRR